MKPNEFIYNEVSNALAKMGCKFFSQFDPKYPNFGMTFDVYDCRDMPRLVDFARNFAEGHEMKVTSSSRGEYGLWLNFGYSQGC